ncbi:16S rRNA (uracil(1498)-N(3))-methyltransferase [Candidatus Babeliales bacterium]|nr:16S rRNA (uracil(1498)-N(3))-methyltransferase [Candidatus Babeliales bacterium]
MNEKANKHTFAIYFELLNSIIGSSAKVLRLDHRDVWKRLIKVLRLNVGESFILFDKSYYCLLSLKEESLRKKNIIVADVIETSVNKVLSPEIILACPILKKDDFEKVVYFAAELGVTEIVPLQTDRVSRKWGGDKELSRLNKIVISAAEQSKNFFLPNIKNLTTLDKFLNSSLDEKSKKIHLDVDGERLLGFIEECKRNAVDKIILTLGPEGDLTEKEKKLLKDYNFKFILLTPTVLKAEHAVVVGLGVLRSLL